MRIVSLQQPDDWAGWREAARSLALADVPPDQIIWQIGPERDDLFAQQNGMLQPMATAFSVPRAFLDLGQAAICHKDSERFALLYALLLRLRSHPNLLDQRSDPSVHRLEAMARAVRRANHKMHAFVRFREVGEGEGRRFVAWFEPEHHIVRANAGFFMRRFSTMAWSILTPELSLHWDGEDLREAPGATRHDAPGDDPLEALWRSYYASIFNPARIKTGAMLKEMPKKYWRNMPETALIRTLLADAPAREQAMIAAGGSP
jgi:probable DNA metabolism protein